MSVSVHRVRDSIENAVCVVVGQGLIGTAVSEQLSLYSEDVGLQSNKASLGWSSSKPLIGVLQSVFKQLSPDRLDLVWCAGKAGFYADDDAMASEFQFFSEIIERVRQFSKGKKLRVSLVSSAGGLYERSGLIDDKSQICVLRPYGKWKLKQEEFLAGLGVDFRIYRASSVYGTGPEGSRTGLISKMLQSAISGQSITISARPNTLRDYIYNVDVAKMIVADVLNDNPERLHMAVTGRAVSISTLLNVVKAVSHRRVMATFNANDLNDMDIVFSRHLVCRDVSWTSLEEGVRVSFIKMISS